MELAKRMLEMNKRIIIGLMAFAIAGALTVSATGANATESGNEPYVVKSQEVSVSKLKYKGTILEDVKIFKGTKSGSKNCKWVNGGMNSGRGADGSLYWYYDGVRAKICKNSNSPTGWVKVAGGTSGRNCGNPYKPNTNNPPGKEVKGAVVMVRSFSQVNMTAVAKATVNLSAKVVCPDGAVLQASAKGVAVAKIKVTTSMLAKAKGDVEQVRIQLKEQIKAKAIAKAKGKIKIKCGTSTTPPTCQGDECSCEPDCTPPQPPTCEEEYSEEECNPQPPTCEEEYSEEECNPKPPVCEHDCKPTCEDCNNDDDNTTIVEEDEEVVIEGKGSVKEADELPNTGPGAVVATFVGVSSFASLAYSAVTRRLGL